MRIKWIFRFDARQGLYRIARLLWVRGTPGLPGGGYSAKLSLALSRRLFAWRSSRFTDDWSLTAFGVRVHYLRSYGGIIV